jgi:hypothetical protein
MHALLLSGALALPFLGACQAAPRARPVKMGPVDTGASSVEAVRRQLQGTWELVSLDVFSPSGEKQRVQANGRLTYDEFGNLAMQGTVTGGPQIDSSALNLSGRVTIDPTTHTLHFASIAAASPEARDLAPQLDASHVRYYELAGGVLTTTTKNTSGATTAIATWKKVA